MMGFAIAKISSSDLLANSMCVPSLAQLSRIEPSMVPGTIDGHIRSVSYPQVTEHLTTGEWNAAALLNNRVEVSWDTTP